MFWINQFKNYFFTDGSSQTQLSQYLEKYSVFSSFTNVKRSIENIDFDIESIVTLKASAEDCRYADYREYTFDYCMKEITKYPAMCVLLFNGDKNLASFLDPIIMGFLLIANL